MQTMTAKGADESKHEQLAEIRLAIDELARRAGIMPDRAFAAWYAIEFFDVDEDKALEGAALDGGEDQGVDLLVTDHNNSRILILQGHAPKVTGKATPKSKWNALVAAIPCLQQPKSFEDAGRLELRDALEEANESLEEYEVLLGLVSLGDDSDQIRRALATTQRSSKFREFEFFYDAREQIVERYAVHKMADSRVPEDTLTFASDVFEDTGTYGRAIVGSVSATELGRLYTQHKRALFADNVRYFVGARKGGINEKIIETAKNRPGDFWSLNNGITIVAQTIDLVQGTAAKFKLTRFSIVNGCQTTVSLSEAGAPKSARVLARVVAAKPALVTDIVQFNNTQTPVKIWTVRSVDPVQERIRQSFARIGVRYAPKQEGSRRKKDAEVIIELDKATQFLAAAGSATLIDAVREKQELFDRHYQNLFSHNISAEQVYLFWLMGTQADDLRQERLADLRASQQLTPVTSALLGVSGTLWGIHCAAALVKSVDRDPLGLQLEELKNSAVQAALRKHAARGLDMFIELAVDTYDPSSYRSVRAALRSPRFLERIDAKLGLRVAREKSSGALPKLTLAARSAK